MGRQGGSPLAPAPQELLGSGEERPQGWGRGDRASSCGGVSPDSKAEWEGDTGGPLSSFPRAPEGPELCPWPVALPTNRRPHPIPSQGGHVCTPDPADTRRSAQSGVPGQSPGSGSGLCGASLSHLGAVCPSEGPTAASPGSSSDTQSACHPLQGQDMSRGRECSLLPARDQVPVERPSWSFARSRVCARGPPSHLLEAFQQPRGLPPAGPGRPLRAPQPLPSPRLSPSLVAPLVFLPPEVALSPPAPSPLCSGVWQRWETRQTERKCGGAGEARLTTGHTWGDSRVSGRPALSWAPSPPAASGQLPTPQ